MDVDAVFDDHRRLPDGVDEPPPKRHQVIFVKQ
jgi:hypothetical protein